VALVSEPLDRPGLSKGGPSSSSAPDTEDWLRRVWPYLNW